MVEKNSAKCNRATLNAINDYAEFLFYSSVEENVATEVAPHGNLPAGVKAIE